jgi:YkoY family integral membrane protein
MLVEYGWVLLLLIAIEGLLAADNALVLAIMVKHLPEEQRKRALFYGLAGAFVFRFASLFAISFLVNVWQVQAIGALYLLFIALNHIFRKLIVKKEEGTVKGGKEKKQTGFWGTVFKVELADIAFAVDSILAAVALAVTLPNTNLPQIGGLDGGRTNRINHHALCCKLFCYIASDKTWFGNCSFCHCRMGWSEIIRLHVITS